MFILESFGTPELLLVGLVALILLGPRKLPDLARKAGKMMSEFRGTANEFKETWQREVNFEEEANALDIKAFDSEPVKRVDSISTSEATESPAQPSIKQIDPSKFEHLVGSDASAMQKSKREQEPNTHDEEQPKLPLETADPNDKKNWL
ncbi:MAG: twin-arginine translocase TatA/TatE family subunit [Chloracidobacterium sp.]|nr:twin-arginine translocase TatA/TatE family subunit [Chloracidobacterium sp.]